MQPVNLNFDCRDTYIYIYSFTDYVFVLSEENAVDDIYRFNRTRLLEVRYLSARKEKFKVVLGIRRANSFFGTFLGR